jgi:hypothetical protein
MFTPNQPYVTGSDDHASAIWMLMFAFMTGLVVAFLRTRFRRAVLCPRATRKCSRMTRSRWNFSRVTQSHCKLSRSNRSLVFILLIVGSCAQGAQLQRQCSPLQSLAHCNVGLIRLQALVVRKLKLGHRVNHRLQVLFNATLGFPGEGPTKHPDIWVHPNSAVIGKDQKEPPEVQALGKMQVQRACHIHDNDEISSREKVTLLTRIWERCAPAMFLLFFSWSCCFHHLECAHVVRLYSEMLRYQALSQSQRNNESTYYLSTMWRRDRNCLGELTVDGWPACVDCYRKLYGIPERSWTRLVSNAASGNIA